MSTILTVATPRSSAIRRAFHPDHAPIVAYPPGMEALAERLSHLDSQAEGALRVVMFYDTLMRRRVDLPALARASAGLAECVAGIRLHGTGPAIRVGPDGRPAPAPPSPASTTVPITLDQEEIGTVGWNAPARPAGSTICCWTGSPWPPRRSWSATARRAPPWPTPPLVELVISADSDQAARARALRLLGSPPTCRSASPRYGPSFRSTRSAAWSARPAR